MHILKRETIWESEWSGAGFHAVLQHRGAIILGPGYFTVEQWPHWQTATVNLWNPAVQSHALQ